MKKSYSKPMVYVESFVMNQHIATCNSGTSTDDTVKKLSNIEEGCSISGTDLLDRDVTGMFYTMDLVTNTTCTVDGTDIYCYTNQTDYGLIFTS